MKNHYKLCFPFLTTLLIVLLSSPIILAQSLDKIFTNSEVISSNLTPQNFAQKSGTLAYQLNLGEYGTYNVVLEETQMFHKAYQGSNMPSTFRGYVQDIPKSTVTLTVNNDFLSGSIITPDSEIFFEPYRYFDIQAAQDEIIVYSKNDVVDSDVPCLHNHIEQDQTYKSAQKNSMNGFANDCTTFETEIFLVADYSMYQKYGEQGAVDRMTDILAQVQTRYDNEFAHPITFTVVDTYVATCDSDTCDPWSDTENVSPLLAEFRDWGNGYTTALPFDVASFWTRRDLEYQGNYSVVGFASKGSVCDNFRYNINEDRDAISSNVNTLVHELGHNFGASHDADGTSFIMSPNGGDGTTWSPESINVINNYIESDDGACLCQSDYGCNDPLAHNYDPAAQEDDGSCLTCTDGIQNGPETAIDVGPTCLADLVPIACVLTNASCRTIRLQNHGAIVNTVNGVVGLYLSQDDNITTDDYLVATRTFGAVSLNPNSYQIINMCMNTDNVPAGTYYIGAIVDHQNVVPELDEDNNLSCIGQTYTVGGIDGCTNPDACNYNPDADNEDGSCFNCYTTSEVATLPCDDGDPCTINDEERILTCDGTVCWPCAGTFADTDGDGVCDGEDACPNLDDSLIGTSCDDGDDCTVNDVYNANCECVGTFQDADNDTVCDADDVCPNFDDTTIGNACDDGSDCSINDVITPNCECVGTIQDTDGDGVCDADDLCPGNDDNLIGTACDDGDSCTTNDVITSNCDCAGTFQDADNDSVCDAQDICPNFDDTTIGDACDDGSDCSINDVITSNCECVGTIQDTDGDGVCDADDLCPDNDDNLIGTTCDDGDTCTTGDVYNSNCECVCTFQDADNDTVCDANDVCPTLDDTTIGNACDDGSDCSVNDVITSNCECVGTIQDTDGDGVCDADDVCPGFDDSLIGTACDDGNACTSGDVITSNCECAGTFQDADNDTVCDADDVCPGIDDTLIGTACDDGSACTTNDTYNSNCECVGTPYDASGELICKPDLVASGPCAYFGAGALAPCVSTKIYNVGQGAGDVPFFMAIYLSEDQDITTDDYLVGTREYAPLAVGENVDITICGQPSLRATVPPGTYYYRAIIDYDNAQQELNEDNNLICGNIFTYTIDAPGGCTDPTACNYDPDADQDNGTCIDCNTPGETSTQSCDDGDPCTLNDQQTILTCDGTVCVPCTGTYADADGDGVCDANDICPIGDDNIDTNENGIPDACEGDACPAINFQDNPPISYGGGQDNGSVSVSNPGDVIWLENNAWKAIPLNYTVTANTVVSFDFRSTIQGEIHGVGFDTNSSISSNYTFRVYGTQSWGISNYDNYNGSGDYTSYTIPVGNFYTGQFQYFFFVTDHDALPRNGNSYFKNVRIYEDLNGDLLCDSDVACNVGAPCNDSDICTINDVYNTDCECVGTVADADFDGVCDAEDVCPNFNDNILGFECDDNDPCTTNDIYTTDCECAGTLADADNDGVCNADDVCPNFDDNLIGTTCDDGDECTINDVYTSNCECAGTVADADFDGVCDAEDVCPNFNDNILGFECDDGDPCTTNDICTTDCECAGTNTGNCLPDLQLYLGDNVSCQTATDVFGVAFHFFNIVNEGLAPSTASEIGLYISADQNFDNQDILMATIAIPPLAPGEVFDVDISGDIVAAAPGPGAYYDFTIIDHLNLVSESDEDNNFACTGAGYTIVEAGCTDPNDTDGDGVCDSDDICEGGDDNLDNDNDGIPDYCDDSTCVTIDEIGNTCDDKNDCTENDVFVSYCVCIGTPINDADGDSVCDEDDPCPNDFSDTCDLSYCVAQGTNTNYEFIQSFKLNSALNDSGDDGGYGDYTGTSFGSIGNWYNTFEMTPGFAGSSYAEEWAIWIDYNKDGDFDDANEEIFRGTTNGTETLSTTLYLEGGPGYYTRMRVAMRWNTSPEPCGTYQYGEVEDYTVFFTSVSDKLVVESGPIQVFPNPADNYVSVDLHDIISNGNVQSVQTMIYTMDGKQMYAEELDATSILTVNTQHLPKASYILRLLTDDGRIFTGKFVKL